MAHFLRINGRTFGPFDETQLLEMKSKGKITRTTEISENKNDWQTAEAFSFLYPPAYVAPSAVQATVNAPADWFYSSNGTEGYGPVTAAAIEQMLQSGQLSGNSYVWQEGQNARFIKNEPLFSSPDGSLLPAETGNAFTAKAGNESMNATERTYTSQILPPLSDSLGWLMFLKITFLISLICQGLYQLWISCFFISNAVGSDSVSGLLLTFLLVAFAVGFYSLQFKAFLCLWHYHTNLYQAVASGGEFDLIKANQSLFLLWKWLSITIITYLSAILLGVTIMMIVAGFGSGTSIRSFPSFL